MSLIFCCLLVALAVCKCNCSKPGAEPTTTSNEDTEVPNEEDDDVTQDQEAQEATYQVDAAACQGDGFIKGLIGVGSHDFTPERREEAIRVDTNENGRAIYFLKGLGELPELQAGYFEQLSIEALRARSAEKLSSHSHKPGVINVREGSGTQGNSWFYPYLGTDALQANPDNQDAVFQVASNFNGLETTGANVDISQASLEAYQSDRTQGPAASISALPGLMLRRYYLFHAANTAASEWEQTPEGDHKINFLSDVPELEVSQAGYVYLPEEVAPTEDHLKKMKVGMHHDTQVIYRNSFAKDHGVLDLSPDQRQIVHQVFTAAADLGITNRRNNYNASNNGGVLQGLRKRLFGANQADHSEAWAKTLLKASYEGTLRSAFINDKDHVFLTLIGGGVFRNDPAWILEAIEQMKDFIQESGLQVTVIVYKDGDDYRNRLLSLVQQTGGQYVLYTNGGSPSGLPEGIMVQASPAQ